MANKHPRLKTLMKGPEKDEMVRKAQAARIAARAERGGISPSMQVTMLLVQDLFQAERMPTIGILAQLRDLPRSTMQSHVRSLIEHGFLARHGVGSYSIAKSIDESVLTKRKLRAELILARRKLGGAARPYADAPDMPTDRPARAGKSTEAPVYKPALKRALKALAPFARYGARTTLPAEAVPSLLRKDGLTVEDFKAAAAALADARAILHPTGDDTPADKEESPYFAL